MTCRLVVDALNNAIIDRKQAQGLIFHTDRGSQYASVDFLKLLKRNGIIQSMRVKGNCYLSCYRHIDNAVAESFFHILKIELIYREKYKTRDDAKSYIFRFIKVFYNRRRRHSCFNYL